MDIDFIEESSSDLCRICMENEIFEELVEVCRCKGFNKKVHKSCLFSWLLLTKNPEFRIKCYLCNEPYEKEYILDFEKKKRAYTRIIFSLYFFNLVYSAIVFILFYQLSEIRISQICIPIMISLPYIGTFIFTGRGSFLDEIHKHAMVVIVYLVLIIIASYFLAFGYVFPLFLYLVPLNVMWIHKLVTYHNDD